MEKKLFTPYFWQLETFNLFIANNFATQLIGVA